MTTEITEHIPGEQWSNDMVRECARVFISTGSYKKTSAQTGVNRNTIVAWEHRANDVWVESCNQLQHEKSRELRNKYAKGAELALDHTLKTLGDATAQQSAIISGVFLDKSRLIDNQATSISGKAESMTALAQEFRRLSEQWEEKQVNVVSTIDKDNESHS